VEQTSDRPADVRITVHSPGLIRVSLDLRNKPAPAEGAPGA